MRFRKKPVVIDAVQWTGDPAQKIDGVDVEGTFDPAFGTIGIETLEGTMRANVNDWIITGVKGERYPCKPDIFAATYELEATHSGTHPWMQTRDGRVVDLIEPDLRELTIDEVAHALSGIGRFTGHTKPTGYSVAQHCVLVSENVPREHAFAGLMHDAHEAILGDISSPVKAALKFLGGGEALERLDRTMAAAVRKRFGCVDLMPGAVKLADMRMLITERRDLLGDFEAQPWEVDFDPYPAKIVQVWSPNFAWSAFMRRFEELAP